MSLEVILIICISWKQSLFCDSVWRGCLDFSVKTWLRSVVVEFVSPSNCHNKEMLKIPWISHRKHQTFKTVVFDCDLFRIYSLAAGCVSINRCFKLDHVWFQRSFGITMQNLAPLSALKTLIYKCSCNCLVLLAEHGLVRCLLSVSFQVLSKVQWTYLGFCQTLMLRLSCLLSYLS